MKKLLSFLFLLMFLLVPFSHIKPMWEDNYGGNEEGYVPSFYNQDIVPIDQTVNQNFSNQPNQMQVNPGFMRPVNPGFVRPAATIFALQKKRKKKKKIKSGHDENIEFPRFQKPKRVPSTISEYLQSQGDVKLLDGNKFKCSSCGSELKYQINNSSNLTHHFECCCGITVRKKGKIFSKIQFSSRPPVEIEAGRKFLVDKGHYEETTNKDKLKCLYCFNEVTQSKGDCKRHLISTHNVDLDKDKENQDFSIVKNIMSESVRAKRGPRQKKRKWPEERLKAWKNRKKRPKGRVQKGVDFYVKKGHVTFKNGKDNQDGYVCSYCERDISKKNVRLYIEGFHSVNPDLDISKQDVKKLFFDRLADKVRYWQKYKPGQAIEFQGANNIFEENNFTEDEIYNESNRIENQDLDQEDKDYVYEGGNDDDEDFSFEKAEGPSIKIQSGNSNFLHSTAAVLAQKNFGNKKKKPAAKKPKKNITNISKYLGSKDYVQLFEDDTFECNSCGKTRRSAVKSTLYHVEFCCGVTVRKNKNDGFKIIKFSSKPPREIVTSIDFLVGKGHYTKTTYENYLKCAYCSKEISGKHYRDHLVCSHNVDLEKKIEDQDYSILRNVDLKVKQKYQKNALRQAPIFVKTSTGRQDENGYVPQGNINPWVDQNNLRPIIIPMLAAQNMQQNQYMQQQNQMPENSFLGKRTLRPFNKDQDERFVENEDLLQQNKRRKKRESQQEEITVNVDNELDHPIESPLDGFSFDDNDIFSENDNDLNGFNFGQQQQGNQDTTNGFFTDDLFSGDFLDDFFV